MKKSIASIVGFGLLIIGFLSLMLMGFGLRLSYLSFIDNAGELIGLVVRLSMILLGLIILYVVRSAPLGSPMKSAASTSHKDPG